MPNFKNTVYREANGRDTIILQGVGELKLSPPPEFGGKGDALSPEEMFMGAINGCLLLTFYYFAKQHAVEVTSYHSEAKGEVEKGKEGFRFVRVAVRAKVIVAKEDLVAKIKEISHLTERFCLISQSVACPVQYQVEVQVK